MADRGGVAAEPSGNVADKRADDAVIRLPAEALLLFIQLLQARTVPWNSRLLPSNDIMLERAGDRFRMGIRGAFCLRGTISREGSTAVIRWKENSIPVYIFPPLCLAGCFLGLGLTPLLQAYANQWTALVPLVALATAIGLGVVYGARCVIRRYYARMEALLRSAAADAELWLPPTDARL